ncbi:MAG TPA: hypothetical protein EYP55_03815, partial [Anaerolineae bacterium]|nr:hypothetical protein [Anaerolineae bacterium]
MERRELRQGIGAGAKGMDVSHRNGWGWGLFLLLLSSLVLAALSGEAASPGDPCSGLVENGCFDRDLEGWEVGGELPVSIAEVSPDPPCDVSPAVRLGIPVPQEEQPKSSAWISQTITIPLQMQSPLLTFCYDIFTNDILHWSSFHVQLCGDPGGCIEILRDGCEFEPGDTIELGWRRFAYDLTPYRGHVITLRFESRNEWDGAWGIWTFVDGIRILEGHPIHLPIVLRNAKFLTPTPTFTPTMKPTPTPT